MNTVLPVSPGCARLSAVDVLNQECFCISLDQAGLARALDSELGRPGHRPGLQPPDRLLPGASHQVLVEHVRAPRWLTTPTHSDCGTPAVDCLSSRWRALATAPVYGTVDASGRTLQAGVDASGGAREHASYVFLLDEDRDVYAVPHALSVALARGETSTPGLASQTLRLTDWYARLKDGKPDTVVNESYHRVCFDRRGRIDRAPPTGRPYLTTPFGRPTANASECARCCSAPPNHWPWSPGLSSPAQQRCHSSFSLHLPRRPKFQGKMSCPKTTRNSQTSPTRLKRPG